MIKFIVDRLPVVLSMLALPISIIALIWALNADDKQVYEPGSIVLESEDGRPAETVQRALERSEENNESVGTVLNLLEVGLALLGAIIAVAAVIFTINLRDIRSDLEGRANANERQVEQRLSLRENELTTMSNQIHIMADTTKSQINELSDSTRGQLDFLKNLIHQELDEARQRAENSFKVLSQQLLAEQQVRSRNYKTAIETLEEAHIIEPENQTTNYLLGYLYTARRQFGDAMAHLNQALATNPDFAPALAALGLAQRRMGDKVSNIDARNEQWAEAEINLLRALKTDSNLLDADGESYYGTLGGLYRRQNRHEDALHAYQHAVEVTPQASYPAGNLAILYKYTGRDDEALEAYMRVEEIAETILDDNSSDHWARLDLAQALLVQGRADEAIREYKNLVMRQPPSGALDSGASGLEFLSQSPTPINGVEEAIQILKEALAERENQGEG